VSTLINRYFTVTFLGLVQPFQIAWHNRYLLSLLIKRDITSRTSDTFFGGAWLLLQPALQILGFWFLLGVIFNIKFPDGMPFVDYFLVSMLPWLFISEIWSRSLSVLAEFSSLYRRALFPVAILPLLPLVLSATMYAVVMALMVGFIEGWQLAPLGFIGIFILALWLIPCAYLLAIGGLFLKDIAQFFPFVTIITLYLTPILYTPDLVPEGMEWVLMVNPVADVIALFHAALQGMDWHWWNILRPLGLWLLVLGPAWVLFCRAEPHVREML